MNDPTVGTYEPASAGSPGIITSDPPPRTGLFKVEYALRDTTKPKCVVEYRLARTLPTPFKNNLPTAEEMSTGLPLMSLVQLLVQIECALHDFATRRGAAPTCSLRWIPLRTWPA